MDFSAPRKSRLSGPQLQAQLSRLTDRTRLRRLKDTLLSKGAWQQVTRIEDLCHAQVSHHLDACAGSVLTLEDYITNVQKRLGSRVWVGKADSVAVAVPSWTHSWNTQKPAATPKPRGGTTRVFMPWSAASNSQTQALRPNPGSSLLGNPGRQVFSPPLLSRDAVLPWTSVWPPPLQRQPAETLHRRHSIACWRTTGRKSEHSDSRTFTTARLCGPRTGGHTRLSLGRFSTRQTSPPAATANNCRGNPFIAGCNTKSKSLSCGGGEQPWLARFPRTLCEGGVALRRYHRQSFASLGTCPCCRRRARRPRPCRLRD